MAETIDTESPTFDTESPYYVHPDIHDLLLSSFTTEKLSENEDNYVYWKLQFLDILRFLNKIGFVDGTIEKPDLSSPLYESWKQCNAIVKVLLRNSMSDKLAKSVLYEETAHKAWKNLRRRFVPCVDLKIYQLRRRLATLRQGGDSVDEYFAKLSKAWSELAEYDPVPECKSGGCNCELTKRVKEAREKEQRFEFLMGLNQGFEFVKTRIMLQKPPPSVYEAYIMVEQEESMMKEVQEMNNLRIGWS